MAVGPMGVKKNQDSQGNALSWCCYTTVSHNSDRLSDYPLTDSM